GAPAAVGVQEGRLDGNDPSQLIAPAIGKTRPLPGKLAAAKDEVLLAVTPDGKTVVSVEPKAKALRLWSWPAGELEKTIPLNPPGKFSFSRCSASAFSPDGKQLVAVMLYADPDKQQFIRRVPDDPFVERWDLTTGTLLERHKGETVLNPLLITTARRPLLMEKNHIRDAVSRQEVVRLSFREGEQRDLS